ncbi:MAG: hypothetical protein FI734_01185 [SAR202 cluster bacterium]|nr:hypothetical protein [SAR202 cluster bacterium]|tara:strand:+ start:800 stop:1126 length:327 start_codon:yes stop_codon:yes gene_type:complete
MKTIRFYLSLLSWIFVSASIVIMVSITSNISQLSDSVAIFRTPALGTGILEDLVGSAIASLGLGTQDSGTYIQDAASSSIDALKVVGVIFIKVLISIYLMLIALFLKK